jgi:hypothetical protein
MRSDLLTFAMGLLIATLGCSTGVGQTAGATQSIAKTPSAPNTSDSGIHGTIEGSGGAPPGKRFYPQGPCASVFNSAGTLIARADCNEQGEFRVSLPAGNYIVEAIGQRLQVQVANESWRNVYFRITMR